MSVNRPTKEIKMKNKTMAYTIRNDGVLVAGPYSTRRIAAAEYRRICGPRMSNRLHHLIVREPITYWPVVK